MALNFDSITTIINRVLTDIKNILTGSNPFLKNTFLRAMGESFALRSKDAQYKLQIMERDVFLATSKDENAIAIMCAQKGITRNEATQARGNITITGVAGTNIPLNTEFQNSSGATYKTQASVNIADISLSVTSITQSGGTAIATTASNHNLATGVSVTISGANESDYNGTFSVVVTGLNTFTYSVNPGAASPATGTILADFTIANVEVLSDDFGQDTNVSAGEQLVISSPIAGVDNNAGVQYSEIAGGTDLEDLEDFQNRGILAWASIGTPFNAVTIENLAKSVSGVTRVWVYEATPAAGQVTIYFVRDNDDNIIPSAGELQDVKDVLLPNKDAGVEDADVIVSAPTPITVNFSFSSITPDTATMRSSITANLEQFFSENTNVGIDILEAQYLGAIASTFDTETGQQLTNFTLSSPTGNISISAGQIGVLGTITF